MATIDLPHDFKEFLKLLNSHHVEYLLIGGYAVAYHGYPRATANMDVWIAVHPENADRVVGALKDFGYNPPDLSPDLFLAEDQIVRMGRPPLRIEVLTNISGVKFEECYERRVTAVLDGVRTTIISLAHLKAKKRPPGGTKTLMTWRTCHECPSTNAS